MAENFDLFGNPDRPGRGLRGRPPYQPTERDRNQIKLLLAMGWSIQRMANAIDVSPATVKRYFRAELQKRDTMRDRLEARRLEIAMEQAQAGNITALRELGSLIDRNDRMQIEQDLGAKLSGEPKATERLGKKVLNEQRAKAAEAELLVALEREAARNGSH